MNRYKGIEISDATKGLKILGHEGRLSILCSLSDRAKSVNELIEATGLSQSNLSQHLARMRDHGILQCEREGHQVIYSIKNKSLLSLLNVLEEIFC